MSESELQKAVLELAKRLGWRTAHFRPGMTKRGNWVTAVQGDAKGFPDLILVLPGHFARPSRLVVIELKSEKGRMTPEQDLWLEAFRYVPETTVCVFRPKDWHDGTIESVLRALSREAAA